MIWHIVVFSLCQKANIMVYLKSFTFPTVEKEEKYLQDFYSIPVFGNQYYTNYYPFGVLPEIGCQKLEFEPITILYGGNGSGKSTILNVIAKKLNLKRMSAYNTSNHMDAYVNLCLRETDLGWMTGEFDLDYLSKISHVITSDDIFRKLLQDRTKKDQNMMKSRMLIKEHQLIKSGEKVSLDTTNDGELKKFLSNARDRKKSTSGFIRDKLGKEEPGISNGENSMVYMAQILQDEGLYLLDEPENSLSASMQADFADLLVYMAKNNSQIIMSTHSPFLLSIPFAKIYNLDNGTSVSKFEELESSKLYFKLFDRMRNKFEMEE